MSIIVLLNIFPSDKISQTFGQDSKIESGDTEKAFSHPHFDVGEEEASGLLVTYGLNTQHESKSHFPDGSPRGPRLCFPGHHPTSQWYQCLDSTWLEDAKEQKPLVQKELAQALRAALSAWPGEPHRPGFPAVSGSGFRQLTTGFRWTHVLKWLNGGKHPFSL